MRCLGAVASILVLLTALAGARAEPFRDPPVLHAGAGVTVTARRATVEVPGFGRVDGLSVYDVRAGSEQQGASAAATPPVSSLMPPVIAADRGATLRILFRDELRAQDALHKDHWAPSNLHTHGLIVSPQGLGFGTAGATPVFGDCVFVTARGQGQAAMPGMEPRPAAPPSSADPCGLAANRPAEALRDDRIDYAYPIAPDHPSGLFWLHPHVHGQSEPQVSNGLGALLTVGRLWDYSYLTCKVSVASSGDGAPVCATQAEQTAELAKEARAEAPGGTVHVRYLALKDIQVLAGKRPGAPFDLIAFPMRPTGADAPDAPAFSAANDDRKMLCGRIDLGATRKDDLVYAERSAHPARGFGEGQCWKGDDARHRWLFTVSGQIYPTMTIRPDGVEVWRLANTSADVTYRLHLVTASEPHARRLSVTVRALDGVATGDRAVDEIVLMPSARIEVLVQRCTGEPNEAKASCVEPGQRVVARLRTAGVATGTSASPDPKQRTGDVWPPVDLAEIVFEPSRTAAPAERLRTAPPSAVLRAPSALAGVGRLGPLSSVAALTAAPAAPASPSAGCDWSAYRTDPARFDENGDLVRLIRLNNTDFGDGNGGELFGVHAENHRLTSEDHSALTVHDLVVEGSATPQPGQRSKLARVSLVDPCFSETAAAAGFAKFYPAFRMTGAASVTAWSGGTEYWLVINDSSECHNFHIHQMKFTVVDSDVVLDPGSSASQDQCLGDRTLLPPIRQSALHDNYPLPPYARVLFRMTFDGPKLGRFVFHCHILEHEDKGMMATLDVVPPPAVPAPSD